MKQNYERGVINWILIIVGILIVLTLVGYFTTPRRSDIEKESGTLPRRTQPDCGLVVQNPKENQKVNFPIQISGYLKSCSMSPLTSDYGTVQLLDGNATPISAEIHLPIVGNWVGQPATFMVSVAPTTIPNTDNGFLLFINHNKAGGVLNTFQVPILFLH